MTKRKLQHNNKTYKKNKNETNKILKFDQPCCSKSLMTNNASQEEMENEGNMSVPLENAKQLEAFFEVDTLREPQTLTVEEDQVSESEGEVANQNVLEHTWSVPVGNH